MEPPTDGRSRLAAVVWSFAYVGVGYVGMAVVTTAVLTWLGGAEGPSGVDPSLAALVQSAVGIVLLSGLTLLVGRRILALDRRELGWAPVRAGLKGFGAGVGLGVAMGGLALSLAVMVGAARWTEDGGSWGAYLGRLAALAGILLPAALAEELAFRGLPVAALRRAVGPGLAVLATALLFGLAHRANPNHTSLGLGNITLAGIWLGLTFLAPGGLWTATGAHFGWNLALAGLAAPVSGIPFEIPGLDYLPGEPGWLTGGSFGPEGGVFATVVLALGAGVAARWWTTREGA